MEDCMKTFRFITCLVLMLTITATGFSQAANKIVARANGLYKEGKFEEAIAEYKKAMEVDPENETVIYNLGNAVFKKEGFDEAREAYERSIKLSTDKNFRERNTYNKGVTYTRQKKLLESITAYKTALKMDPADADARHNLQKALYELKKQNQSGDNNKQNDQKKQQQQQKKQQQQQQQQQSKFNRKQVEQLMKALRQKEQEIQQKMQQNRNRAAGQPDKDW
ncbi:MAG: tetratricopeptide repeat protein [Chitinophagaceae bacterium]|nr:MAG: tetratricopeptide repeat protein [Chitinophagaceae bacterium]